MAFINSPIKGVGTDMDMGPYNGQIMSQNRYNSLPRNTGKIQPVGGPSVPKGWQNPNITIKRKAIAAKM